MDGHKERIERVERLRCLNAVLSIINTEFGEELCDAGVVVVTPLCTVASQPPMEPCILPARCWVDTEEDARDVAHKLPSASHLPWEKKRSLPAHTHTQHTHIIHVENFLLLYFVCNVCAYGMDKFQATFTSL